MRALGRNMGLPWARDGRSANGKLWARHVPGELATKREAVIIVVVAVCGRLAGRLESNLEQ